MPTPLNLVSDTMIQDEFSRLDTREQNTYERQTALEKQRADLINKEDQTLQPLENEAIKREADMAETIKQAPRATAGELKPPTQQIVSPKEYTALAYSLLGMALVGGAVSKGNWLGVSQILNGAMQGYIEGRKTEADQEFENYKRKFDAAKAHDDAAQKEFEDVIYAKNLSINEKLNQIKLTAARYDRQDLRLAAESKSFDSILKQIEASRSSLIRVAAQNDRMKEQLAARQELMSVLKGQLTPKGQAWLDRTVELGNMQFFTSTLRRFGGAQAMQMINQWAEEGLDPGQITAAIAERTAQAAALRMNEVRNVGVQRLTLAIQSMENNIMVLAKKTVPTNVPLINRSINDIRRGLGQGDVVQLNNFLKAVARQYIEAITMPGSNAQLHASSSETADELINLNMSLAQMDGAFKAMNQEIAGTSGALSQISLNILDKMAGGHLQEDLANNKVKTEFIDKLEGSLTTGAVNITAPTSDNVIHWKDLKN